MTNFDILIIGFLFGIGFTFARKLIETIIQKIISWYAWRRIRKLVSTVPGRIMSLDEYQKEVETTEEEE